MALTKGERPDRPPPFIQSQDLCVSTPSLARQQCKAEDRDDTRVFWGLGFYTFRNTTTIPAKSAVDLWVEACAASAKAAADFGADSQQFHDAMDAVNAAAALLPKRGA
jgi:hypothetical protein